MADTPETTETPSEFKRFRTYFITGLLVLGPVMITLWIIVNLFILMDSLLGRPIQYLLGEIIGIPFFETQIIYGIGFITLILLVMATGWLSHLYLGNRLVILLNKWFDKIPLVNKVYGAILQISQALLGGQKEVFKYAVMVEYPRRHMYSIGFVTQDTRGAPQDAIAEDVISIFIPTTPNPTSGYLLFVPKKEVAFLNMSVEEALKLIISAGALVGRAGGGSRAAARKLGIRLHPLHDEDKRPDITDQIVSDPKRDEEV
ncbi:MAG TPA: DUF502 domain-containing protein [Bacteroidetes bacterium]|nr:hypothetical protein BMS3Bbin04_00926 [bacterium BMS3Bbin04]HDO65035.1 DUF502 domain-containing protein [Bacteroidota bacterium]HEX04160.1 DUF502 domain-containing protein [Bacteroidota bacterium]